MLPEAFLAYAFLYMMDIKVKRDSVSDVGTGDSYNFSVFKLILKMSFLKKIQ